MTTIVTRLYANATTAEAVAADLRGRGFPESTLSVLTDASAMAAAGVPSNRRSAYAAAMAPGNGLLVVRAPDTPFGAARAAIAAANTYPSMSVGLSNENAYEEDVMSRRHSQSVIPGGKLYLTADYEFARKRGPVSTSFGLKLLSRRRTRNSAWSGTKHMLGTKLVTTKKRSLSVIRGGKLWSEAIMIPTLAWRPPVN